MGDVSTDDVRIKFSRKFQQQSVYKTQAAQEFLPAVGFSLVSKNTT